MRIGLVMKQRNRYIVVSDDGFRLTNNILDATIFIIMSDMTEVAMRLGIDTYDVVTTAFDEAVTHQKYFKLYHANGHYVSVNKLGVVSYFNDMSYATTIYHIQIARHLVDLLGCGYLTFWRIFTPNILEMVSQQESLQRRITVCH